MLSRFGCEVHYIGFRLELHTDKLPEFFESMREYGIETLQSSIYLTGERLLDAYAYVIYGGRLRGRYQEAHFHNTLPEARE